MLKHEARHGKTVKRGTRYESNCWKISCEIFLFSSLHSDKLILKMKHMLQTAKFKSSFSRHKNEICLNDYASQWLIDSRTVYKFHPISLHH